MPFKFRTAIALSLAVAAGSACAQQMISVSPSEAMVNTSVGYQTPLAWKVLTTTSVVSGSGTFVDMATGEPLSSEGTSLTITGDNSSASEQIRIDAETAARWYADGVRRVAYRRTFGNDSGRISGQLQFSLTGSGAVASISGSPVRQTLSMNSKAFMLDWQLDTDLGQLDTSSEAGQFLVGDQVVYDVQRKLTVNGSNSAQLREEVRLPQGVVQAWLNQGIQQVRYNRTFTAGDKSQRSASVVIDLAR